ncbi:Undecaprenyl phosphate-alpha-4-amino-4-deoxy-L-arabinose arabinosyl transferase [uncultured archaeon]|nr:Undecaprenyl phosphate-alpha-4-amino-4-deoxy-L-arabinose arabinosyl transferase [uncultured archaeon]
MDSREAFNLSFIALVFISSHLLLFDSRPFYKDEALYATTIDEFLESPSVLPTFNRETFTWKPMLFFYYGAAAYSITGRLGVGLENGYRLASAIPGFAASILLFLVIRRLTKNADLALLSATIFAAVNATVLADTALLTDSLLAFLVLAGFYFYIRAKEEFDARKPASFKLFLALAFTTSFLAFLTKTYAALLLPALAVTYLFFSERKLLSNRLFLATLAAPLLAAALHIALFASQGMLSPILAEYFFNTQRAKPFTFDFTS